MYAEIVVVIIIGTGIAKGMWEYRKDRKDTECGNFLLKED